MYVSALLLWPFDIAYLPLYNLNLLPDFYFSYRLFDDWPILALINVKKTILQPITDINYIYYQFHVLWNIIWTRCHLWITEWTEYMYIFANIGENFYEFEL